MAMFMRKLNIIARCAGTYRTQNSSVQLPGVYHSYVFAICKNPGMSQDKIAKHLCRTKSSVTRHLAYLEQNGYVERKPSDTDKREMLVYPTKKMLDIHAEVVCISQKWNTLLSENIPEEKMDVFSEVLEMIYQKATKHYEIGGDQE